MVIKNILGEFQIEHTVAKSTGLLEVSILQQLHIQLYIIMFVWAMVIFTCARMDCHLHSLLPLLPSPCLLLITCPHHHMHKPSHTHTPSHAHTTTCTHSVEDKEEHIITSWGGDHPLNPVHSLHWLQGDITSQPTW